MAIKKLNSMFRKHNRWLFGGFALVTILAFVFMDGGSGCFKNSAADNAVVGSVYGEKVKLADLNDVILDVNTYQMVAGQGFSFELMSMNQIFPAVAMVINGAAQGDYRSSFYAYGILKMAESAGYKTSDREVMEAIKASMNFMDEKRQYSPAKFEEFIRKNDVDENKLYTSIRNYLTIRNYPMFLAAGKVSDAEVEAFYRSNYPRLILQYALFKYADFEKQVKIDENKLAEFHKKNSKNYMTEGYFDALVVEVSGDVFLAEAEKQVSEKDVAEYNRKNKAAVKRIDLVKSKALDIAKARIDKFYAAVSRKMNEMSDDKTTADKVKLFRDLAAEEKFILTDIAGVKFGSDRIGNIEGAGLLVKRLQEMPVSGSLNPLTRVFLTRRGVAVAVLKKRVEPVEKDFKAARADVEKDFRKAESVVLAEKALKAERAKIVAAKTPAEGSKLFNAIIPDQAKSFIRFSLLTINDLKPEDAAIVYAVSDKLSVMKSGEYTDVVPGSNGVLLVKVSDRKPAFMGEFEKNKEMIRRQVSIAKAQSDFADFMNNLAKQCIWEADQQQPVK